jgi:hypothetical protein
MSRGQQASFAAVKVSDVDTLGIFVKGQRKHVQLKKTPPPVGVAAAGTQKADTRAAWARCVEFLWAF